MTSKRMHDDELHSDEALVGRLIAAQFPQWAELPIERFDSPGTANAIYRLGDEMAVRLPLRPGSSGEMEKEHRWLPLLAPQLPLEVPEPLAAGVPGERFPEPWCVHRWLDGAAVTAENTDLMQAARALGEFVVALRGIDATGGPGPGGHNASRGFPLATRDGAVRSRIEESHRLVDTGAVTAAWEMALAAPVWDGAPVWIHGDLMPGNLLVRDGVLTGVIDFGCLGTGDPACDLMVAWHLLTPASREVFREVVGADDASWMRGRGWALSQGIIALPYYVETNARMAAQARHTIDAVLADFGSDGR
jgi:aminoglycoside phosphotransferase (APT) family kinase protein